VKFIKFAVLPYYDYRALSSFIKVGEVVRKIIGNVSVKRLKLYLEHVIKFIIRNEHKSKDVRHSEVSDWRL
jgi:hypothetical protein